MRLPAAAKIALVTAGATGGNPSPPTPLIFSVLCTIYTSTFSNHRNVALLVNDVNFYILGSPELIAKTGLPKTVDDLCQMIYTSLIDQNTGRMWPWSFANVPGCFPTAPSFITDDPEAELVAALAGIGYAQLGDILCEKYIQSGQLVAVLQDQAPAPWGIYVYRPQRGPVAERVRVVFDFLVLTLTEIKLDKP